MDKKILIIVVIVIIIAAVGLGYFGYKKGYWLSPKTGGLQFDLGGAGARPLENMPSTNPFEEVVNPFEEGYRNPFK